MEVFPNSKENKTIGEPDSMSDDYMLDDDLSDEESDHKMNSVPITQTED
jgi:hypothetical protein